MSSTIPLSIRNEIREKIWRSADSLDWARLNDRQRSEWYENWSRDKDIGGVIARFMDARKVRVYIKDALLKPYLRELGRDGWHTMARSLDLPPKVLEASIIFEKPHGAVLPDGRVLAWGNSRDWKAILFAVFERAEAAPGRHTFAIGLSDSSRITSNEKRILIEKAASLLRIDHLVWID